MKGNDTVRIECHTIGNSVTDSVTKLTHRLYIDSYSQKLDRAIRCTVSCRNSKGARQNAQSAKATWYTAFKAKVALAAVKSEKTIAQWSFIANGGR